MEISNVQKQPHQPYNSIQFFTQSRTYNYTQTHRSLASSPAPRSESSAAAKYRRRCKKKPFSDSNLGFLATFCCFPPVAHPPPTVSSIHPFFSFSQTPHYLPSWSSTPLTARRPNRRRQDLPDHFVVLDDTGFHFHRWRGPPEPSSSEHRAPRNRPTIGALSVFLSSLSLSYCTLPRRRRRNTTTTGRVIPRNCWCRTATEGDGPNKSGTGELVWPRERDSDDRLSSSTASFFLLLRSFCA